MNAVITIRQEALPVLTAGLDLKRRALDLSLARYRARLLNFEMHYIMTSDQFTRAFESGELGDETDWFEWEFVLDAYRETKRQVDLLRGLQL